MNLTVNEIQLVVDNLAVSFAFYRDVLGLSPGDSARDMSAPGRGAYNLDGGGVSLKLLERPADEPSETSVKGLRSAPFHLCFKVYSIAPVVERLRRASVRFALEPKDGRGNIRVCFFYDPDGILLELTEGDIVYDRTYDEGFVTPPSNVQPKAPPRLDHFAVEVADRAIAASAANELLDFRCLGELNFPELAFDVTYLSNGRIGCELFDFGAGSAADHFDVSQRWRIRLAALSSQRAQEHSPTKLVFNYEGTIEIGELA